MGLIDEIAARVRRTFPGPWYQGQDEKRYESSTEVYSHANPNHPDSLGDIADAATPAQARFIAHLHTDLSALLEMVQGLRPQDEELLDEIRERLEGIGNAWAPAQNTLDTRHGPVRLIHPDTADLIANGPTDIRFLLKAIDSDPIHVCSECAFNGGSTQWIVTHTAPEFLDMSARCWECDTRETGNYFEARLSA